MGMGVPLLGVFPICLESSQKLGAAKKSFQESEDTTYNRPRNMLFACFSRIWSTVSRDKTILIDSSSSHNPITVIPLLSAESISKQSKSVRTLPVHFIWERLVESCVSFLGRGFVSPKKWPGSSWMMDWQAQSKPKSKRIQWYSMVSSYLSMCACMFRFLLRGWCCLI